MVKISKYYKDKCKEFALAQLGTSERLYTFRGEQNRSKIVLDIKLGKYGEVAAYQLLKNAGFELKKPDFKIYTKRRKSFDADLITECGKHIHVKTQSETSRKRYGSSWLFQKSDKLAKTEDENDYIMMLAIDDDNVELLGCVQVIDLIYNDLFESPKVPRYAKTKYALYLDSILAKNINVRRLL